MPKGDHRLSQRYSELYLNINYDLHAYTVKEHTLTHLTYLYLYYIQRYLRASQTSE